MMDVAAFLLNVAALAFLLSGVVCLVCWYLPNSRLSFDRAFRHFLIMVLIVVGLMTLMRYVRMEE